MLDLPHAGPRGGSGARGPTLFGIFGRPAGGVSSYKYSSVLREAGFVWNEQTIDALFDEGPDRFIPGSKMPMQTYRQACGPQRPDRVPAARDDGGRTPEMRAMLIAFLAMAVIAVVADLALDHVGFSIAETTAGPATRN